MPSEIAQGYSEFRLTRYPSATPLINNYAQGSDPAESLGPHWERPGRTIVDEHLTAIPDPETIVPGAFQDFTRVFFTGLCTTFIQSVLDSDSCS